jgi:hypothetical protein
MENCCTALDSDLVLMHRELCQKIADRGLFENRVPVALITLKCYSGKGDTTKYPFLN